jgi:hypothetical protein
MKRAFILAAMLLTGTAAAEFRPEYPVMGTSSRLICSQFNQLTQADHDGALSWALGFVSGWQFARSVSAQASGVLFTGMDRGNEGFLTMAIERRCRKYPNESFPLAVANAYEASMQLLNSQDNAKD